MFVEQPIPQDEDYGHCVLLSIKMYFKPISSALFYWRFFLCRGDLRLIVSILNETKTIDRILISWCTLSVKHFVVVPAFVVNKCIFISGKISLYFNHFANKSNNQETVLFEKYLLTRVSVPNFYCSNFNGRAFPLEFVRKCRVESRDLCVTNGAENSTSTLAKN